MPQTLAGRCAPPPCRTAPLVPVGRGRGVRARAGPWPRLPSAGPGPRCSGWRARWPAPPARAAGTGAPAGGGGRGVAGVQWGAWPSGDAMELEPGRVRWAALPAAARALQRLERMHAGRACSGLGVKRWRHHGGRGGALRAGARKRSCRGPAQRPNAPAWAHASGLRFADMRACPCASGVDQPSPPHLDACVAHVRHDARRVHMQRRRRRRRCAAPTASSCVGARRQRLHKLLHGALHQPPHLPGPSEAR